MTNNTMFSFLKRDSKKIKDDIQQKESSEQLSIDSNSVDAIPPVAEPTPSIDETPAVVDSPPNADKLELMGEAVVATIETAVVEPEVVEITKEVPEPTEIESSKKGWFSRLKSGLGKTRSNFTAGLADLVLGKKEIDDDLDRKSVV